MSPELTAVVEELDAHRVTFEAFCRSLSEEQLNRPVPRSTWLVRDFIAHLATIDGPVGDMFRTVREGGDPGIRDADGGKFDVDHWNDRQVERRRERSVDDLLAEAAESRAELKKHLLALTETDLASNLKFGGDNKRRPWETTLLVYLQGWCKHDPMHVVDMLRALPDAHTPGVDAWVDDPVVQGYQAMMNR
ncbi:MAG: maleylpyruvate isomerase N-terminal domain-containing protein [Dehalococcoidia bacterium]|nr:maleylpyruvate isomerase N-terminal domain-containing protein [Dehalococcoidia bacterium]